MEHDMGEVVLEKGGVCYTAEYEAHGDELSVYLPNGECRRTTLNGLMAETAALTHLRSYVKSISPPQI
jgi:hypothetical protein